MMPGRCEGFHHAYGSLKIHFDCRHVGEDSGHFKMDRLKVRQASRAVENLEFCHSATRARPRVQDFPQCVLDSGYVCSGECALVYKETRSYSRHALRITS